MAVVNEPSAFEPLKFYCTLFAQLALFDLSAGPAMDYESRDVAGSIPCSISLSVQTLNRDPCLRLTTCW